MTLGAIATPVLHVGGAWRNRVRHGQCVETRGVSALPHPSTALPQRPWPRRWSSSTSTTTWTASCTSTAWRTSGSPGSGLLNHRTAEADRGPCTEPGIRKAGLCSLPATALRLPHRYLQGFWVLACIMFLRAEMVRLRPARWAEQARLHRHRDELPINPAVSIRQSRMEGNPSRGPACCQAKCRDVPSRQSRATLEFGPGHARA